MSSGEIFFPSSAYGALLEELGRRAVEREEDVLARRVPGLRDRVHEQVERRARGLDVRGEAALVADARREPLALQDSLQRVEDLGPGAERVAKRPEARGHEHELLDVERVVGVRAAVHDVHHRDGERHGAGAAEVAEEGERAGLGRGAADGHRDAEDRVRAELRLRLGAVEVDHQAVDLGLLARVHAEDLGRDRLVDVLDGREDALAAEALLVAVAQLEGLARAGGRAGRHAGAPRRAALEEALDFDGRVAAGIEDLAGVNAFDGVHVGSS